MYQHYSPGNITIRDKDDRTFRNFVVWVNYTSVRKLTDGPDDFFACYI
jgi:hypothetical protein